MSLSNPPSAPPDNTIEDLIDNLVRRSIKTTYAGKIPITAWEEVHIPTLRKYAAQELNAYIEQEVQRRISQTQPRSEAQGQQADNSSPQTKLTHSTLGWISKKLDEHAKSIGLWDMNALALQTVVGSGKATPEQKREWNDMVTERRAIAIITGLAKEAAHEMRQDAVTDLASNNVEATTDVTNPPNQGQGG